MIKITTTVCRGYPYKNEPKTQAKTKAILIDTEEWKILTPTSMERSLDKTKGRDVYCLEPEKWKNIAIVIIEQPSRARRRYKVVSRDKEVERALKEALMVAISFPEMEARVKAVVEMMKMLSHKKEVVER